MCFFGKIPPANSIAFSLGSIRPKFAGQVTQETVRVGVADINAWVAYVFHDLFLTARSADLIMKSAQLSRKKRPDFLMAILSQKERCSRCAFPTGGSDQSSK